MPRSCWRLGEIILNNTPIRMENVDIPDHENGGTRHYKARGPYTGLEGERTFSLLFLQWDSISIVAFDTVTETVVSKRLIQNIELLTPHIVLHVVYLIHHPEMFNATNVLPTADFVEHGILPHDLLR